MTGGNPVDTGGAISASENVSISNSQLLGNETSKRGGAIYLEGGALFTANTTISDNKIQVNNVGPSNGGAIYIRNGVLDLVDSTISANEAYAESISLAFSTGTISNTQINNNLSSGIGAFESQVTITDSTLQGNVSGISGGGMFLKENSKATIIDSNIIDNVKAKPNSFMCQIAKPLLVTIQRVIMVVVSIPPVTLLSMS